jgi:hypothetical protein
MKREAMGVCVPLRGEGRGLELGGKRGASRQQGKLTSALLAVTCCFVSNSQRTGGVTCSGWVQRWTQGPRQGPGSELPLPSRCSTKEQACPSRPPADHTPPTTHHTHHDVHHHHQAEYILCMTVRPSRLIPQLGPPLDTRGIFFVVGAEDSGRPALQLAEMRGLSWTMMTLPTSRGVEAVSDTGPAHTPASLE